VTARDVKYSVVAIACVCAAVLSCGPAAANLIVGVNDNVQLEAADSSFFMSTMQSEGLTIDALTLRWDDLQPSSIDPGLEADLQQVIGDAQSAGITVELDLYPLHSAAFTDGRRCRRAEDPVFCGNTAKIDQFAAWTAMVAQTFPTVHEFVVMNECNQPLFVNPQWNAAGFNQSAAICGRALAAAYDSLKHVDPTNFVWGLGLSPRGNDAPGAATDSSTSPVHFLEDLGIWFRAFAAATHRKAPLMDGFDFHPYPVPQSMPFATGYGNPRDASVANLPRIYEAFYLGFNGTGQRTIGQQRGGGLPVSLNEMGIQTDATGRLYYQGVETSANAAGGVMGRHATQAYQSFFYENTLSLLACDPNVSVINIYHLVDEPDLEGWQSGLYWFAEPTPIPKKSAAVVARWIARTGGACQGTMRPWHPEAFTPPESQRGSPDPLSLASVAQALDRIRGRPRRP
jgi:hypothetical protein